VWFHGEAELCLSTARRFTTAAAKYGLSAFWYFSNASRLGPPPGAILSPRCYPPVATSTVRKLERAVFASTQAVCRARAEHGKDRAFVVEVACEVERLAKAALRDHKEAHGCKS